MSIIKKLREKIGFSQHELAQEMGVDRTTVVKWETEKSVPPTGKLLKLAGVLGCSVDDLLKEG